MKSRFILSLMFMASIFCCVSCKQEKEVDEPFYDLRGVILTMRDINSDPEVIDWLGEMQKTGLNTISLLARDYTTEEYLALRQKCIDMGFDVEIEDHGLNLMLPRDLFAVHPEYFRIDKNGERRPEHNGCPSNPEVLKIVYENAKKLPEIYRPTNHRYYFWLEDNSDKCHCPDCEELSMSDQALMFENVIIKALREVDPEAKLAHLAYQGTTPAPTVMKPEPGIFLEFAPIQRSLAKPISDSLARCDSNCRWSNGDYMQMLKDNLAVFGTEDAMVLDYWLDCSLASGWKMPRQNINFSKEVFESDLKTYAGLGIRKITTYGVWLDEEYARTFKDISCIEDYGYGLRDYRPQE